MNQNYSLMFSCLLLLIVGCSVHRGNRAPNNSTNNAQRQSQDEISQQLSQRLRKGQKLYSKYCSSCHGENRGGSLILYPGLKHIGNRMSKQEIQSIIEKGSGMMPAFGQLSEQERTLISEFLLSKDKEQSPGE